MIRKTLVCIVLALAVLTLACPKRTSIADVTARPEKFRDKSIAVAGVVKESYGLSIPGTQMGGGLYKLDDGTGSLWIVVSEGSVPPKVRRSGFKGEFQQA